MKHLLVILFISFAISCASEKKTDGVILASVYDKNLYLHELSEMIPDGLLANDSVEYAKRMIDKWIHEELMLKKAELNLTDEQKDVTLELDDYRSSLLRFKYQTEYVNQKMDTIVPDAEIENYFEENKEDFILADMVVKGLFVQIAADAPDLMLAKKNIFSTRETDSLALVEYCLKYATKFDYFKNNWIALKDVQMLFPASIQNADQLIRTQKRLEFSDSAFHYFLRVDDYLLTNEQMPISFAKVKIHSILQNRKKIQLINELEENLYQEAVSDKSFKIYELK